MLQLDNSPLDKPAGKIKIILVDDHVLVREGWAFLLGQNLMFDVIAQTGSGEEAIELAKMLRPDVVIMDINLAGMSGIEATQIIQAFAPEIKIMCVSMYNQPELVKKMLEKGAAGYITKTSKPQEMYEGVLEISAGRKYICTELKDSVSGQLLRTHEEADSLSEREIGIANLIRNGLSSKQIASKLRISYRTVEVHRYNILKKFKLKNSIALVNLVNEKPHLLV